MLDGSTHISLEQDTVSLALTPSWGRQEDPLPQGEGILPATFPGQKIYY